MIVSALLVPPPGMDKEAFWKKIANIDPRLYRDYVTELTAARRSDLIRIAGFNFIAALVVGGALCLILGAVFAITVIAIALALMFNLLRPTFLIARLMIAGMRRSHEDALRRYVTLMTGSDWHGLPSILVVNKSRHGPDGYICLVGGQIDLTVNADRSCRCVCRLRQYDGSLAPARISQIRYDVREALAYVQQQASSSQVERE